MASEKLGMVPSQQMHNGLISHPHPHPHTHPHPQLVYPEFACSSQAPHRRSAAAGDPGPKSSTQELTASFLDHRHFYQHHHQPPPAQPQTQTTEFRHQWTNSRSSATPSGGEASEDDDVEDEDDDEDDDNDDEDNSQNIATVAKINHTDANEKFSNSNNNQKLKQLSALVIKEGNSVQIRNGGSNDNNNSIEARNIGEEVYYAHYLHGAEGLSSSSGQKDIMTVENGCGNSKRKESCYSSESQESLRTILSDPLTGALMDDAMILRCGHSFGSGGVQQIIRMPAILVHSLYQRTRLLQICLYALLSRHSGENNRCKLTEHQRKGGKDTIRTRELVAIQCLQNTQGEEEFSFHLPLQIELL
ncbi:Hypothetical predicted protein [Olea europaea subsp. europaea]|uniref:Uncharacterized protein n=1 Tax=Olea europaea subsp. europaea TaxID=158383 RepID=A0A8S0PT78_OLEEU|nr:Hypothetical predicted protein [Olea europaea subsp. europaea]